MVLALTESHVPLDNSTLREVLAARHKRNVLEAYAADMAYMAAKAGYKRFEAELPSKLMERMYQREVKDARSGEQIKQEVLKRLRQ